MERLCAASGKPQPGTGSTPQQASHELEGVHSIQQHIQKGKHPVRHVVEAYILLSEVAELTQVAIQYRVGLSQGPVC